MRTGAEAGSIEIRLSSKDVAMPDDKRKHTPESVAAKVVKALLKVPPKKGRAQRASRPSKKV
jgi:hypothetical protein